MAKPKNTTRDVEAQDAVEQQDVMPVADPYSIDAPAMPPLTEDGGYTVEGHPIPDHLAHAIPFELTDQGKWEKNQGKPKARVQVTRDSWDQMIEERRDQPWSASDPLQEAVDRVREPGMRYRALSPVVIEGRGMRGWEPVLKENGDQIRIGGMFLAKMPEHVANKRNDHYRAIGNEQLRNAEENLAIEQERVIRNAGKNGRGLAPLRAGDALTDSRNPDSAAVIGFDSSRGGKA